MPAGDHGDVARGPVDVVAVLVDPEVAERRVALARVGVGREPPGLAEIRDLVPVADALRVNGLPHAGRPHHVHVVVVALRDLVLVVLVQHLAEHRAIAERLPPDLESQVDGRLPLNLVDDAHPQADGPDGVVRTHDRGKSGDHRACGSRPGGGSEELAPVDSLRLRSAGFMVMLGFHVLPPIARVPPSGGWLRPDESLVSPGSREPASRAAAERCGDISATPRHLESRREDLHRPQFPGCYRKRARAMSVLIKNGRIVTAVDDYHADIFIDDETVTLIGRDLIIDARHRHRCIAETRGTGRHRPPLPTSRCRSAAR